MAEVPQKSVGPRFELSHWTFFSCHLPSEQCPEKSLQHLHLLTKNRHNRNYQCGHSTEKCKFSVSRMHVGFVQCKQYGFCACKISPPNILSFLLVIVCRGHKDGITVNSNPYSVIVWSKRMHNKSLVRET